MSSVISMETSEIINNASTTSLDETSKHSVADLSTPTADLLQHTTLPQQICIPEALKSSTLENSSITPLQIANFGNNIYSLPKPLSIPVSQKNVILRQSSYNKPQQIVIQNPNTLQTIPLPITLPPKNPLTYVTMIKTTKHIGIPTIPKQKFVLASMPSFSNRLATTMTTNSVHTKLALKPHSLENSASLLNKQRNMINVKISNGKVQTDSNGGITVMCSNISNERMSGINDKAGDKLTSTSDVNISNSTSSELTLCNDSALNDCDTLTASNKTVKHGISILKKNFTVDTKCGKEITTNVTKVTNAHITTISDQKQNEVQTTATSITNINNEDTIINIVTAPPQKSERRRKSHFACRQDYDEPIFTESDITPKPKEGKKKFVEKESDVEMIINRVNIKPDINMNEDLEDINDLLVWEEGIGTLPGSDLKFIYNKYKFLQILTRQEYIQIMNKRVSKSKTKQDVLEEMCCLNCGCFGLPSEFISPKYCSYDCRDTSIKALRLKERNFRLRAYNCLRKNKDINFSTETTPSLEVKEKSEVPSITSEEELASNENSQDKYSFPWYCSKKGFSWAKYLEHMKAKAAPLKLFKDPFPYNRNGFRPGMKLEGIDPLHPSYFCVLTVVEVVGYRIRLHFDGYSDNYDFWVNADSMDIFPAGWCEKYGHELRSPPGYENCEFSWTSYMKNTRCILAPKHLFADRGGSAICPNGFRIGMKLEAVDRKNTSLVCVATVTDTMDNRLLIHFDSWDDIYDYWTDPTSPYIHPVGWADKNGHSLTPPNNYPNPESFTWENYLKEQKCLAAPARAFKQRPPCGFKKGMRLECVDKRVPRLIRVATVDDIKDHQIRISFDGWPDRYSYWVDSDSPDIHPAWWCYKTGHPIEPPLTPADVYDFLECPTVGCRGQGHIEGAKFPTHSLPSDCPYSDANMNKEHVLPDRLLSPDRQLESVIPVSREPKERSKKNTKVKRLLKTEYCDDDVGTDIENEDVKPCKKSKIELLDHSSPGSQLPLTNGYISEDLEAVWEEHSRFLFTHIKNISHPELWDENNVARFISSLPDCDKYARLFEEQCIDGPAFLMLSQKDLVDILNVKLGPAIKIYSIIILLRRHSFC